MPVFSSDEINLIFIYNNGDRGCVIASLKEMLDSTGDEDAELRVLAEGVIKKLEGVTDKEFKKMSRSLIPDFGKDE